jgi:hypothetical protein
VNIGAKNFEQTQGPANSVGLRHLRAQSGMQGSGLLGDSTKLPDVECAAACDLYDGRHVLAREIVRADLPVTRRHQQLLSNKDIDCIIVPKVAFSPNIFARWRCGKEYGTGVAGDLPVHLIRGMMVMLDIKDRPNAPWRWAASAGGKMDAT